MSLLNTRNPYALQSLMSETVFDIGFSLQGDEEGKKTELNLSAEAASVDDVREELGSKPTLQLYGGNQKNILFIVDESDVQFFSPEAELAFLKTLEAMKLALSDVAVVNRALLDPKMSFDVIQKELLPVYCVFLGTDPANLHMDEYPENMWSQMNGSQILKTYSFDEMLTDAGKKRTFWNAVRLINK